MTDDLCQSRLPTCTRHTRVSTRGGGRFYETFRARAAYTADEVVLNKAAIITNPLRALEAAVDFAMRATRVAKLGLPRESPDEFALLERAGWI